VSKSISRKILYVVVALAMLAMMIPMAIPASATTFNGLTMTTANSAGTQVDDSGYDVIGTVVTVTASGPADNWTATPISGNPFPPIATGANWAQFVSYSPIEVNITAQLVAGGAVLGPINKKWGNNVTTAFTQPNTSSYVTWNEGAKTWTGSTTVTDTVTAQFNAVPPSGLPGGHLAQGMILNWYLIDGYQNVPMTPMEANPAPNHNYTLGLTGMVGALVPARFAQITGGTIPPGTTWTRNTYIRTISDANGASTIAITTTGEESIKIVVIPEYPGDPQIPTTPEVTTYNFKTREMEVVPQVRWAGEKIILEAKFGIPTQSVGLYRVKWSLSNESPGSLTAVANPGAGFNNGNSTLSVWAPIDAVTGLSQVMLECANQGQVDVVATLYLTEGLTQENQQLFTVYYLKLESIKLSDVVGKRSLYNDAGVLISHKDGLFTVSNPWNPNLDWETANPAQADNDTINVSTDALLRAQVKGWFVSGDPSWRTARYVSLSNTSIDQAANAPGSLLLPAGRWVLPDDWALLSGTYNRIHWDISIDPSVHNVMSTNPKGPYMKGLVTVAAFPVVGPFSPGLEVMTDTGWAAAITSTDALRPNKTVVPDGVINAWDAPMPPAKVAFEITNPLNVAVNGVMQGVGYFKDAWKTGIYYIGAIGNTPVNYTNPFYFANIPAHELIPPTNANGGYDWDSFGINNPSDPMGPYPFWKIINEPDGTITPQSPTLPTKVEVYSDNHGEAMVYLNGDANLNRQMFDSGADIPLNATVGHTTVTAYADYPYYRSHQVFASNSVQKTWFWSGQVLGVDGAALAPMVLVAGHVDNPAASDYIHLVNGSSYMDPLATGTSNKHVVFVWATDRDGMQAGVLGARVDWSLGGAGQPVFYDGPAFTGINPNGSSPNLSFEALGFLANAAHPGVRAAGTQVTSGSSWLRAPTTTPAGFSESDMFYKFYNSTHDANGLQPSNFAVAAIEIITQTSGTVNVMERIYSNEYASIPNSGVGSILRQTDFTTTLDYPLDDQILLGDANLDGNVNMLDITAIERIILGMDTARPAMADANHDQGINMGDVIRVEKIYLGLK
jgi:hypothetical protein